MLGISFSRNRQRASEARAHDEVLSTQAQQPVHRALSSQVPASGPAGSSPAGPAPRLAEILKKKAAENGEKSEPRVMGAGSRPAGSAQEPPLSLALLVARTRAADQRAAKAAIELGRLYDAWVALRLRQSDTVEREEVIAEIRSAIAADGMPKWSGRVNECVKVYYATNLLGADAAGAMPLSALRVFLPLIRRCERTGQWSLRPEHADETKALWQRTVSQRLSAAAILEGRNQFRPPRSRKRVVGRADANRSHVFRLVPKLQREDWLELRTMCDRLLNESITTPSRAA